MAHYRITFRCKSMLPYQLTTPIEAGNPEEACRRLRSTTERAINITSIQLLPEAKQPPPYDEPDDGSADPDLPPEDDDA